MAYSCLHSDQYLLIQRQQKILELKKGVKYVQS